MLASESHVFLWPVPSEFPSANEKIGHLSDSLRDLTDVTCPEHPNCAPCFSLAEICRMANCWMYSRRLSIPGSQHGFVQRGPWYTTPIPGVSHDVHRVNHGRILIPELSGRFFLIWEFHEFSQCSKPWSLDDYRGLHYPIGESIWTNQYNWQYHHQTSHPPGSPLGFPWGPRAWDVRSLSGGCGLERMWFGWWVGLVWKSFTGNLVFFPKKYGVFL